MDAEPLFTVPLSGPTYHALTLVARIDRMEAAEIVETLVAAYLETRLGTIHEGRAAREVIDLAAQRERRGPTERTRSGRFRRFRSRYRRSGGEPSVGFGED